MKTIACIAMGVAASLAATGCVSRPELVSEQRCEWPEPAVASASGAVPVHKFAGIDSHWTLARIFARLGPAQRAVASEPFAYEWDADDGRVFVAAAASRCGIVRRARFEDEGRPGS